MKPFFSVVLLIVSIFPYLVFAQTTIIIDAVKDNAIYEELPNNASGQGLIVAGLTNRGDIRRALIQFDLSAIPSGMTVTEVSFSISVNKSGSSNDHLYSLHRITTDWGEGTSVSTSGVGASAIAPDATWSSAKFGSSTWSSPGGDFVSQPSSSGTFPGSTGLQQIQSSADLVADVQGWLDGDFSNFGWILIGDEAQSRSTRIFDSRDIGVAPQLTITYNEPIIIWTGTQDNTWETPENWSTGIVPTVEDDVTIPQVPAGQFYPIVTGLHGINSLEISAGAEVTVTSSSSLAIYGAVSGIGKVIFQKNVEGAGGYNLVSSPISDLSFADLVEADFIRTFDGDMYSENLVGTNEQLGLGQGYFVGFNDQEPLLTLEGQPNTGDVFASLIGNQHFQLVGNPYLAAISLDSFRSENHVNNLVTDGVYYFWQDGGATDPVSGERSGSYLTVTASASVGGDFDGFVRSGQGFFVRTGSFSDSEETEKKVKFSSEMQSLASNSNSDVGFFRKSNSSQGLRIAVSNQEASDETLLLARDGTGDYDLGRDAIKFKNTDLSIYTLLDTLTLAIQDVGIELPDEIRIGIEVKNAGTYSLSFAEEVALEYYDLYDAFEGKTYNLQNGVEIEIVLEAGILNDRWRLVEKQPLRIEEAPVNIKIWLDQSIHIHYHKSGIFPVSIYNFSGQLVLSRNATFTDGLASINHRLKVGERYILRIGNDAAKFYLSK